MPDSTITDLPNADVLSGIEYFPCDQGGSTVKATASDLAALVSDPAVGDITGLGTGVATWLATPSSANLASAVTDETGSGLLVFATSPTLTTPTLGVASATSINKVAITAPATSATLTIADGKTLTVSRTLTLTGTDSTTMTFPSTTATIARTDAGQTFTGTQTFSSAPVLSSLTAGRIPYVGASKDILDSANLTWDNTKASLQIGGVAASSGNDLWLQKTVNGQVGGFFQNLSTGTSGFSIVGVYNSANGIELVKYSTGFTTSGLLVANLSRLGSTSGALVINTAAAADIIFATNGTATTNERLRCDSAGNVTIGNAALATNATDGFLYIPTCAGAPSGTPTSKTGRVALVYDSTNDNFYIYRSGWKKTTTFS